MAAEEAMEGRFPAFPTLFMDPVAEEEELRAPQLKCKARGVRLALKYQQSVRDSLDNQEQIHIKDFLVD
jgi:hypothetical protein